MNTSHLETANRQQSPEYRTLRQMLDRCYRESYPKFHRYGGPYWKPTPAVQFIGPLNAPEWAFFNSYGVNAGSIQRKEGA